MEGPDPQLARGVGEAPSDLQPEALESRHRPRRRCITVQESWRANGAGRRGPLDVVNATGRQWLNVKPSRRYSAAGAGASHAPLARWSSRASCAVPGADAIGRIQLAPSSSRTVVKVDIDQYGLPEERGRRLEGGADGSLGPRALPEFSSAVPAGRTPRSSIAKAARDRVSFQQPYGIQFVGGPVLAASLVLIGRGNRNYRIISPTGAARSGQVSGWTTSNARSITAGPWAKWEGNAFVTDTRGFRDSCVPRGGTAWSQRAPCGVEGGEAWWGTADKRFRRPDRKRARLENRF